MSLRVWLPLNGDLRNNGLDNITVTNNGATVDNNGKIGKCYYLSGNANSYINTNYSTNIGISDFSISLWVKIPTITSGSYYTVCTSKSASAASSGFGIYWNYSQKKFLWSTADGTNATEIWMAVAVDSIVYDKWIHLVMVRNNSDEKKGYFYINGERYELASIPAIRNITIDTKLLLGKCSNGSYPIKAYYNDFRIYDHALSVKEIKEISKGLVCHYPLNNNAGQENLFNWGNKGNKIITLNNYQNTGSFTQFSGCLTFDAKDTVGTTYTISFWAKSPNGTTSLLLYNNNSTPRYFYFSPTTLTTSLNNKWQYFTYTFTNQDRGSGTTTASIYNRIEIYMPSKMGGQVKLIKIEKGDKATIWSPAPSDTYYNKLGYDSNIIYDSSGYNYHAVINGDITITPNTPRNSLATHFTSGSYIRLTDFSSADFANSYTFSWWGKFTQTSNHMMWGYSNGNRLNLYMMGGNFYWNTGDGGSNPFNISASTYADNMWHHMAVTGDGTTTKLYIDGEFKNNAKTYKPITGTILVLNGWDTGTQYKFNGDLSDFRIYATALSADDIKELYQTSASIDKNGNMFAYEYKED